MVSLRDRSEQCFGPDRDETEVLEGSQRRRVAGAICAKTTVPAVDQCAVLGDQRRSAAASTASSSGCIGGEITVEACAST
jgi:hypothetical protein